MSSDCEKMKDQIADHITGILSDAQMQSLKLHLNECKSCREYAQALKKEDALLTVLFAEIEADITNRQEQILQKLNQLFVSKQTEIPSIRRIIMKSPITKLAAVVAVVLSLGAIAVVGVNIARYHYYGQNKEGAHIFISEDLESVVTLDPNKVTDVEQTRRDLEEIELLRQQDKRELLKVKEMMTDGTLEMKVYVYKYELSDGRTIDMPEGGIEGEYALADTKFQEWRQLNKAGPGEDLGTYEQTIKGRVFSFKREKYSLNDGTEILWSVGTPKDGQ